MSQSFADLGISRAVASQLTKQGIREPFPIQRQVIPDALAGHDVLAQSPTGSGKTLAFVAPILDSLDAGARRPAALVLAPTRELAAQIVDDARPLAQARGLKTLAVFGGVGIQPQIQKARKAHLLVATPGRLLDLLDRRALTLEHVQVMVLDEADRMLDMGFRPDVERILKLTPKSRQTLLFSATLAGEVDGLAKRHTRNARRHENRVSEETRPDIEHRFVGVEHQHKLNALVNELKDHRRRRAGARVRQDPPRRRPPCQAAVRARRERGGDARRQGAGQPHADARLVRGGTPRRPHRDRRRRPRHRRPGHHPRDQLRSARGSRRLRSPDRPDGAGPGSSGIGVTFVMADQAHEVGRIARALDLTSEFGAVPHGGRRHVGSRPDALPESLSFLGIVATAEGARDPR